jgi:hypothetical protein
MDGTVSGLRSTVSGHRLRNHMMSVSTTLTMIDVMNGK